MALNDKELTKKVADAWHYFQKLEDGNNQLSDTDSIEVNNSEMINAASWAASYFSGCIPKVIEKIMDKLEENKIYPPAGNIITMTAQNEVNEMAYSYTDFSNSFDSWN